MIVYAESSAMLAWLLGEAAGSHIEGILANSDEVVTSDLTLVECNRAFQRELAMGRLTEDDARRTTVKLDLAVQAWRILRVLPSIAKRAGERFPREPIRSLDALHVASALHARSATPDIIVLSLDDRIRRVAESVGFSLLPS